RTGNIVDSYLQLPFRQRIAKDQIHAVADSAAADLDVNGLIAVDGSWEVRRQIWQTGAGRPEQIDPNQVVAGQQSDKLKIAVLVCAHACPPSAQGGFLWIDGNRIDHPRHRRSVRMLRSPTYSPVEFSDDRHRRASAGPNDRSARSPQAV